MTPMQELLQWLGEKELKPVADHIRSVFLEKEKEFVGKVWNAGFRKGWQEGENKNEPYDDPALSKTEFLNQLYPEK